MAKYIDADALAAVLDRALSWLQGLDGAEAEQKLLQYIKAKLEQLPAADVEPAHRWTSVEDGLPEEGQTVLCWYEYFRYGNYNRLCQAYGLGFFYHDDFWSGEVSNGNQARVIAWMPLPGPPEGE